MCQQFLFQLTKSIYSCCVFYFIVAAFFTELLDNAKVDLHEMFVRTYGLLYQQNAAVFTDLFKDLRNYYKGHNIDLIDALDKFFSTLMQRMFSLMNAQYQFDQEYLQCVTERIEDLKPFGDVPQKLRIQVKRAFIAARTFVQGLSIGRDVILAVSKVSLSYTGKYIIVSGNVISSRPFQVRTTRAHWNSSLGEGEPCGILESVIK